MQRQKNPEVQNPIPYPIFFLDFGFPITNPIQKPTFFEFEPLSRIKNSTKLSTSNSSKKELELIFYTVNLSFSTSYRPRYQNLASFFKSKSI
jgi:hypothetical protein